MTRTRIPSSTRTTMTRTPRRGLGRAVATAAIGATLVAGSVTLAAPAASAMTTTTTAFKNSCQAVPSSSLAGGPQNEVEDASVTVEAPETVSPGEEFEVIISPPPISVPNSPGSGASLTNVSRLKIDVEMPQNATFVSGEIVPGTSSGLSGVAPNVLVVNESGNPDPNGSIIRLSGDNQTIANSPSSSTNSEGGIRANATGGANTEFQLPQVKATLIAGQTGEIHLKLRTAGAAGNYANNANFLTFLPRVNAPLVGTVWAPTRCSPRDSANSPLNNGAGPLATVTVARGVADTVTHLDGPSTVVNGSDFTLTATVVPTPDDGQVQFTVDGHNVGAPVDVVDGRARLTTSVDEDGGYAFAAEFLGSEFSRPSTGSRTVTVTSQDIVTTTTLIGPDRDAYRDQPVNLTAQVQPGVSEGEVAFEVNGQPVGSAEVKDDGIAVLPYSFDSTGTHQVVARFSGSDGISGSVAPRFPVSVTEAPAADVATTLSVDAVEPVERGTPVVLTARLDPAHARGTVQFRLGGTTLGGPVRVGPDGTATLTTHFQSPGEFAISAEFAADPGFIDSDSAPVDVTVTGAPDEVVIPGGGGEGSLDMGSLGTLFGSLGG